jgi:hypothetical protein
MAVSYEWIVEQVDEHGDIVDTDAHTKAADALAAADRWEAQQPPGHSIAIGLTRNTGDADSGLTGRSWAYITDGKLAERFTQGDADGIVPKRYHDELARAWPKRWGRA